MTDSRIRPANPYGAGWLFEPGPRSGRPTVYHYALAHATNTLCGLDSRVMRPRIGLAMTDVHCPECYAVLDQEEPADGDKS